MNSVLTHTRDPINDFSKALEFLYSEGFRGRDFVRASEHGLRRLLMEVDFLPDFPLQYDD